MQGMEPFKKMILVWNEVGNNVASSFRVRDDMVLATKDGGEIFEISMDEFMAKPVDEIVRQIKGETA
jgi:hypothetical protein